MFGLALSGGGARGMFHLGVLETLDRHGVHPDVISGTSIGAVIGALYVHGKSPTEMRETFSGGNLSKYLSLQMPARGLSGQRYLREILSKTIPSNSFKATDRPLLIHVTNLNTGLGETWVEGPLIDLVIASSSVPMVFEPARINGYLYTDGGVTMNLPARPLKTKAKVVVGVNLVPHVSLPDERLGSVVAIGSRCFDLAVLNNINPQRELCDLLIEHDKISEFTRFHFRRNGDLFTLGQQATEGVLPELKELLET